MIAVTFDFGQTLAELDHHMLAERIRERGFEIDEGRARTETPGAWSAYGEAKREGLAGRDAWCTFMRTLLERSGLSADESRAQAEWLFDQQPARNLWRKPIAGMFELALALVSADVPVGIVSNSEGKLAELVAELGHSQTFRVIADSGVLGYEKPDPRIFEYAARGLGVATADIIHVGDAWEADVVGALAAGARAIWFQPSESRELSRGIRRANDAIGTERALTDFGLRI